MMNSSVDSYPFVRELVTDAQGQVRQVVLDIANYQTLLEALEDEGLYRAMNEVCHETPFSLDAALNDLD